MLLLFVGIFMVLNCSVLSSQSGEVSTVFADEEVPHAVANADGEGYYNDTVDNRLRYKIENGEASVYAMNDNITSTEQNPLVIPQKVSNGGNVYDVTSIGECGFDDCENLISIVISNWITSIGEWAFSFCKNLTSITIPNGVMSISDNAFNQCSSLTSIIIPNSVKSIGESAFRDCSNLISVTIGSAVESIGKAAFCGCYLSYLEIPDSVTTIDAYAFGWNSNLKTAVIGTGWVNSADDDYCDQIFWGCDNLTDIYVGSVAEYQSDLDMYKEDEETTMTFYVVTTNNDGTFTVDTNNGYGYITLQPHTHMVRASAVDEDDGANVHVITLNSDTALASSAYNLLWTKKGNSGNDAKVAYKVVVDGGCYGPLPQGANGEPISWKNGNSRIKSTTPVGLSGDVTLDGTYSTFPNTGVGVDIILPSAIILTLSVAICFVAFGGKKKKIIVK